MTRGTDIATLLNVARQIMTAAGCAALITTDESGFPSSRAVRTFPSDDELTRIAIPTHPDSRKTHHVRSRPDVVLSYIDAPGRGYVTVAGRAVLNERIEDRRAVWVEPFSVFWPDGPESDEYLLIDLTPERIELRSFTLGIAPEPTRWTPEILQRTQTGGWRHTHVF